jgi:hypothetical protein
VGSPFWPVLGATLNILALMTLSLDNIACSIGYPVGEVQLGVRSGQFWGLALNILALMTFSLDNTACSIGSLVGKVQVGSPFWPVLGVARRRRIHHRHVSILHLLCKNG